MKNKIYGEKHIPMITLWCPNSVIMADFLISEALTAYYSYCFDYLLYLVFKGSYRNIFEVEQLIVHISTYATSSFLPVEHERTFYYTSHPLID